MYPCKLKIYAYMHSGDVVAYYGHRWIHGMHLREDKRPPLNTLKYGDIHTKKHMQSFF